MDVNANIAYTILGLCIFNSAALVALTLFCMYVRTQMRRHLSEIIMTLDQMHITLEKTSPPQTPACVSSTPKTSFYHNDMFLWHESDEPPKTDLRL